MSAETVDLLRKALASLHPQSLEIEDESALHAGHAGAREGGHYRVTIVAEAFAGKSSAARHRMIYAATGNLMRGRIHALSINAKTSEEV